MSEPPTPTSQRSGWEPEPQPPQAGAQPPTEPEPTPSAAPSAGAPTNPTLPAAALSAGHYAWVPGGPAQPPSPSGSRLRRLARDRGVQLAAAIVLGAVIGGGTVAIVDNVANHQQQPTLSREGQTGGPFGGGAGHRLPGFRFGRGGQRSGN